MSKLTLEIPSDLADALRLPPDERLARIQRELVMIIAFNATFRNTSNFCDYT